MSWNFVQVQFNENCTHRNFYDIQVKGDKCKHISYVAYKKKKKEFKICK